MANPHLVKADEEAARASRALPRPHTVEDSLAYAQARALIAIAHALIALADHSTRNDTALTAADL